MEQKNALISVYDKTGIVEFAQGLKELGWDFYSSGGTATKLNDNAVPSSDVASLVGGKAILGHKVVTISRELAAGELADISNEAEMREMKELGLPIIHLVCVDCYPLKEEIAKPGATLASVLAKTDVGGMNMLHAAAKGRRIVLCDAADRPKVLKWLQDGRPNEEEFINYLCAKAEAYCADYELASAMFLSQNRYFGIIGEKIRDLRYGENPQQKSFGLFETFGGSQDPLALSKFQVIVGDPGHINSIDLDCMLQTITHVMAGYHKNNLWQDMGFKSKENFPYVAIGVKHGNACGAAISSTSGTALMDMIDGNVLSIFGGSIITNFPITEELADIISHYRTDTKRRILDVVIAPAIEEKAKQMLMRKKDRCKMAVNPALAIMGPDCLDKGLLIKSVRGGFLVQENYHFVLDLNDDKIEIIGKQYPLQDKIDLVLGSAICATNTSNTIILTKNGKLIGSGVGQKDRLKACNLAIDIAQEAGHITAGAIACSDSFFPFPDGPKKLINAGIKTIFTPSGSENDQATINIFQENNVFLIMIPNEIGRMFYGH